nr:TIGR04282 family arsenosugar biosynthesis glycosyltransferase [Allomuricauda sp.]
MKNRDCLLLIFTRNPELGKCKTRLAAKVGDGAALDIYQFLLQHTVSITHGLTMEKWVFYSNEIWEEDVWTTEHYKKKLQKGEDLGERMLNAFREGFQSGYEKIIIIGSDMYDLSALELEAAFQQLGANDFVVGPAQDGGYYLLGMTTLKEELFQDKTWGTGSVLPDTMENLKGNTVGMLPLKNDVDHYEDIKDIEAFRPFLKHMEK